VHKRGDTGKAALAHGILGEVAKETLNQVHPRAGGRGEVKDDGLAAMGLALEAVSVGDPTFDLGVFVDGVIVDDEMEREIARGFGIEMLEEGQPLAVRVARCGLAEDLAVEIGERGKQRDGAVTRVVVGLGADVANAERQPGLGTLQRLLLALLVAAQHQRLVRWIEIEADHIPELGLERRVVGQLKMCTRCSLILLALHSRCTVAFETPMAHCWPGGRLLRPASLLVLTSAVGG
jgi:hypothetical protein